MTVVLIVAAVVLVYMVLSMIVAVTVGMRLVDNYTKAHGGSFDGIPSLGLCAFGWPYMLVKYL